MLWWQWWQAALTSHLTMTEFKAEYIQGDNQLIKALGPKHLVIPTTFKAAVLLVYSLFP